MRLDGKVAIVTGAGQGIGEAAARKMAQEGARVVVSDVNRDTGESVAAAIREAGGTARFVAADVSSARDVEALIAAAVDAFGRLDVLHNNAGVHETAFTDTAQSYELDEEIWDRVVSINLKGTWLCSKYAAPALEQSGGGAIVNAASIGGLVGYPMGAAYGPSKAGVVQLTRVMAIELAPRGIRVNCYAPGNTDTPMVQKYYSSAPPEARAMVEQQLTGTHLIPRLATPEEVANLVVFLASDEASAMTGGCVVIDNGTTAWRGIRD
ncbi:MAG TPA: SDR family NAD(P)-dependent oxidoreductase [Solirubrobacteraceae bacterium]|nr:SDR family NAD(P)-dependent oxidoreductase [Solirubrobacteraceae bacterium]